MALHGRLLVISSLLSEVLQPIGAMGRYLRRLPIWVLALINSRRFSFEHGYNPARLSVAILLEFERFKLNSSLVINMKVAVSLIHDHSLTPHSCVQPVVHRYRSWPRYHGIPLVVITIEFQSQDILHRCRRD